MALLLLAFGLRLYRLANKSVWWDEGWTVWVARQPVIDIAQEVGHDVHPPLYFSLLHFWRLGSGDSEFGLRLFSAVFGVLTVAATYLLGRTVSGRTTGLLAALFVVISRFSVVWSQEMRMYSLAALLAVLGLWAAVRVWDRGRPVDWSLYVLFMTAGLYTLYLFAPVIVAANLAWLWVFWHAEHRWRAVRNWAAAQLAVLALFLPWFIYALRGFLSGSAASPVAPLDFLKIYWTVLTVGIPLDVERFAPLTLPVLAIFLLVLAFLIWQSRHDWRWGRNVAMFLIGLLLPVLIVYLVSIPKEGFYAPQFAPRYLVIFTTYYAVLMAWGIRQASAGRRWPLAAFFTLAVVTVSLWGLRSYYPGRILVDDYVSLVATLDAYERPNDAVVLYTDRDWPIFAYHHPGPWLGVPHLWDVNATMAEEYLTPIWEANDGVWLVVTPYAGVGDPQAEMPAWLASRARATVEYSYEDKALRFYARTQERAAMIDALVARTQPQHTIDIDIGTDVELVGYELATHDYKSGDTIHLFLYWDGHGETAVTEAGLMDEQGRAWKWAQVGNGASPNNLSRQQVDLVVPPEAPSGEYTFYAFDEDRDAIRFGQVQLRQKQTVLLTPADVNIARQTNVDFGAGIRLLGYDVETESPHPGGTVRLTLYWQAQTPIEQRFKVFTHLLGEVYHAETENFLWGQQDNEPVNNSRPTSSWRPGEVIVDSYAIPISPQAPAGSYRIEIGLYEPVTGERLPVVDEAETAAADHLILTDISVTAP